MQNPSKLNALMVIRSDLEPDGQSAVSYRNFLLLQIPALTSPACPPIIRPCLAPMPYAASRATLPPTATFISTTSLKGIVRNGTAVSVASLHTWSLPTGAPCSLSKSSLCDRHWTPGPSRTAARFRAAKNMPSPRCAFFRLSMKVPSRPHRRASQPGKWSSTNPTLKSCSDNWASNSDRRERLSSTELILSQRRQVRCTEGGRSNLVQDGQTSENLLSTDLLTGHTLRVSIRINAQK